jgi:hypothetical protein
MGWKESLEIQYILVLEIPPRLHVGNECAIQGRT